MSERDAHHIIMAKKHGTHNDFVIVQSHDDRLYLTLF